MTMTKFKSSIGVLVSSWLVISHVPASDAFRVSTVQYPPFPRSRTGVHQPSRLPSPRLLPVEQCLYAKQQEQETMTTKQAKIRSMASFLVTQMLEKVMLEATSDQSKLTEADAMSLLETLQNVSEAKKAQDKMSTTWQAAEDAVEETFTKDEEVSVAAPFSDASETVEKVTAAAAVAVDPKQVEKEASPTESIVKEAPNVVEASSPQSAPLTPPPKSISDPVASAPKEQFQRSLLAARLQNERVSKVAVPEPVAATAPIIADAAIDSGSTTLQPRFPEIISKEFGKPLEVAASDVPALRETSIPHRSTNETEDLSAGENSALKDVVTTATTIQPIASLQSEIETALNPEKSPTALVDEMSYDNEVKQDIAADTMEAVINDNDTAGEEDVSVEVSTLKSENASAALVEQATVVEEKDTELVTKAADTVVAASVDKEETKNDMLTDDMDEGKSADGLGSRIKSFWNQRRSEPMFPANNESTTATTTMTTLGDDDTPSDEIAPTTAAAIQQARKQPRSPEEEARLAAKYGQIQDLGERAYTILKDLGMI